MALRNLSDGKRLGGSLDALEDVQRRADSLLSQHGKKSEDSDKDSSVVEDSNSVENPDAPEPDATANSTPDTSDDETLLEVEIQLPTHETDAGPAGDDQ